MMNEGNRSIKGIGRVDSVGNSNLGEFVSSSGLRTQSTEHIPCTSIAS